MSKIAIILVRGTIATPQEIRDTLRMLKITRKNHCTIREKNESIVGMVTKVKDLVTWGELNAETEKLLTPKMQNTVVRLQPPRKGFGRKGIKLPFKVGGALGYRGAKINDLIKRMV